MNISLVIALIGTLAAVSFALERLLVIDETKTIPGRRRSVYTFVVFFLAVNVLTQWLQYVNTSQIQSVERKKQQGDIAFSLWAFRVGDLFHLQHLAVSHPFLLGYWYYKEGRLPEAEVYLRQSIRNNDFVAPSYYVLATIKHEKLKNDKNPDFEEVKLLIDLGLSYDSSYSPLYLARALVRADQHEKGAAMLDLEKAIYDDIAHCGTVDDAITVNENVLHSFIDNPEFVRLRKYCTEAIRGLLNPIAPKG